MSGKVLYIHGFGSCGSGNKARALAEHFGSEALLAPDLPVEPRAAIRLLSELIADDAVELLVGSSLGGFYALWLNGLRPVPAVLINPSVRPWATLAPHVGTQRNWCTGEPFELRVGHLEQMQTMARAPDPNRERYLLLLASHDELLDYRESAALFAPFEIVVDEMENHRFERIGHYLPLIDRFHGVGKAPA